MGRGPCHAWIGARQGPLLAGMPVSPGNGDGIHNLGAHVARYHARPDIVYLPIHDWAGLRWGLVWREDAETEMVRALADVVRDLGTAKL